MLLSAIVRTVDFCICHVWGVIVLALFLAATSGAYAVHHFAIDTNVNNLISRDLPWRQRELDYQAAFPQSTQLILVVVDAPTPEEASAATRALASNLSTEPKVFRSVQEEGGGSFFNQNRFLFLPTEQVERSTRALAGAAPIIRVLVKDPSLRGLVRVLSYGQPLILGIPDRGSRQKGPQFRGIGARSSVSQTLRSRNSAGFRWSFRPSLGSRFSNVRDFEVGGYGDGFDLSGDRFVPVSTKVATLIWGACLSRGRAFALVRSRRGAVLALGLTPSGRRARPRRSH